MNCLPLTRLLGFLGVSLVLFLSPCAPLLAQSETSTEIHVEQLEARLPELRGLERFDVLIELMELAEKDRNLSRVLSFGEEAQELLPSFDDPDRELNLVQTLLNTYARRRDLDQAFNAARRLLELGRELDDQESVAFSFLRSGDLHRYRAEHSEALEAYAEAVKLYRSLGNHLRLGRVLNNSALVYRDLGNPPEQLRLLIQAREALEAAGHLGGIALTSNNIGAIYRDLGQYEEAEASYRQALTLAIEAGQRDYQAGSLGNLGRLALGQGDAQGALDLFQQSLDIYLSIGGNESRLGSAFGAIGDTWAALGDDTRALEFYGQALDLATKLEDRRGEVRVQSDIAQVHRRRGELDTAIEMLEGAARVAREKEFLSDLQYLSHYLQEIYAEVGRYREAYAALQEYEALSSESLGEESRRELAQLQAGFEAEEREREIELLEADQALQQAELERHRDFQRALVFGFVLTLGVAILLFNWHRLRTRAASMAEAVERERTVSAGLREIDQLKDEFLANTSHELRTPLYGMTGLVEALLEESSEVGPDARVILNTVLQSGRRLNRLVGEVLDFSKLQHEGFELFIEPVDLYSLADVVLTLSGPLAAGSKLELLNSIDPDLPSAGADQARVEQILHNLVGNAIKFTEQGRVEVSAHLNGDELEVRVSDTGIGIEPEHREKVFEFFVQADASTQREYGGTGLGLAVSRQLVELHGGRLTVESTPGKGSVFSFTLPVAGATATEAAVEREHAPALIAVEEAIASVEASSTNPLAERAPLADRGTILIVDDESVVRQVLRHHLVPQGYRVLDASSGAQALELLESDAIDLVLLDIMMPKMTGYEVCRTIREASSRDELPVIFLSAKDRQQDRVAGFDVGANDYLAKPIGRSELLARVDAHLELLRVYRCKEEEVQELRGLLPICSYCKKIRDDDGYWSQIEVYISRHTEAQFSHGICPDCVTEHHPDLADARQ